MVVAQERYLDKQFQVQVETNVVYGNNISILNPNDIKPIDLLMDVYQPVGDNNDARPVMMIAHTGSFLPPLFNGGVTGARSDSTVTYIAKELASRGYVVAAYTNRQGWAPQAMDEDVRRSTLLQAAYRGIQDTRSCIRNLRRSVAEDGNPYNIDDSKIGVVGIGTGGYLALGSGSLYNFEEVLLPKFINTQTALPYIDSTVLGNIYGDTDAMLCLANHPGYSSDFNFSFNLGGALGDVEWMDGDPREPMYAGVHATNDIFAPYGEGPVIVPTTNEFVVNVAGTWAAINEANNIGSNDAFSGILNDPLADLIDAQKGRTFPPPGAPDGFEIPLGTDNFYGFETPFPEGSPWDWWDKATLDAVVAGTNAAIGTMFDADVIHMSSLATNSTMSPEKGKTYMDTIFQLMLPRACVALELACTGVLSTEDLVEHQVSISPNPSDNDVLIETGSEIIRHISLLDMSGKLINNLRHINSSTFTIQRGLLSPGVYFARLEFDDGYQSVKFMLK